MIRCKNCQSDNPDNVQNCQTCGEALSMLCTNCQSELPEKARFCMFCGHPVITKTAADEDRQYQLAATTPTTLAQKLRASSHLSGDKRPVTALLFDVVGSTHLSQQVTQDNWDKIINGFFEALTPAIYRYEGSIARLLGDSLLAFFGAPVVHEDDPERAVNAALDAMTAGKAYANKIQAEYGLEFPIRASLNTGDIVVGPVRDDLNYDYKAKSGAVNLVSLIKFASKANNIIVTDATHRFIAPLFETEPFCTLEVKTQDKSVQTYIVKDRKEQPGSVRGLRGLISPMVGRDAELQILIRLSETVRAGLGRAILITGEPGIGKTRLMREWQQAIQTVNINNLEQASENAPLWAECRGLSFGSSQPYHLLVDGLRSLIGVSDWEDDEETRRALHRALQKYYQEDDPEVTTVLSHLLSLPLEENRQALIQLLDPEGLLSKYQSVLRKFISNIARHQPLFLIFEDLHWADPSSIDVISQILPLVNELPILICMITRLEQDSPGWELVTASRQTMRGSLTEIDLHALNEQDSRILVANLLEIEALPERVRKVILQRAEGNPFFVEEVIRMLIDRGAIIRQGDGWVAGNEIDQIEIPENLQGLLLARIDRLPDEVREILRVAAVIGRQFSVKVLAEVLAEELENGPERKTSDEPTRPA